MKKRIMMCAESSHLASGFGTYTKEVLSRLFETNKYTIAEFSCYRDTSVPKNEPWIVYPNAVKKDDPRYAQYNSSVGNHFGQWRFDFALMHFKPHIVFDIRDYWMFSYQESSVFRDNFKWIIGPTIDSMPQKREWMQTYQNADIVLTHTEWAMKQLRSVNPSINLCGIVNDSVDTNVFMTNGSKSSSKLIMGLPTDTFIIGSVMRNQKRKLMPDIFDVLQKVKAANPNKNIALYLHTSYPEMNGWDLPDLLLRYGVQNNVYLTYKCKKCNKMHAAKYQGPKKSCVSCGEDSAFVCSVVHSVSTNELAKIYNAFDVYLQYSICEGFGIPQVEAAACGLPVVSINHGAMSEVTSNIGGDLVDVQRSFIEMETGAERVYPDNNQCASILNKYVDMSNIDKMALGEKIRKNLELQYSWDKTSKVFENLFDEIDITQYEQRWQTKPPESNPKQSINDMPSNRNFVYYIIDNVLNYPQLKKSSFAQDIIAAADLGYSMDGKGMHNVDKKTLVKLLEVYMNNKDTFNKMLFNEIKIPKEYTDFLNYA